MCVRACQREEVGRAKGHRDLDTDEASGKRGRKRREAWEKGSACGGDGVDDGRIIHSAAQKKGEERVLCVCDRARRSATSTLETSGLAAERSIVILVRYVLKKYAAGLNESLRKSMWH